MAERVTQLLEDRALITLLRESEAEAVAPVTARAFEVLRKLLLDLSEEFPVAGCLQGASSLERLAY